MSPPLSIPRNCHKTFDLMHCECSYVMFATQTIDNINDGLSHLAVRCIASAPKFNGKCRHKRFAITGVKFDRNQVIAAWTAVNLGQYQIRDMRPRHDIVVHSGTLAQKPGVRFIYGGVNEIIFRVCRMAVVSVLAWELKNAQVIHGAGEARCWLWHTKSLTAVLTAAMLDRVIHHASAVMIQGKSCRLKDKRRAGLVARPRGRMPAQSRRGSDYSRRSAKVGPT